MTTTAERKHWSQVALECIRSSNFTCHNVDEPYTRQKFIFLAAIPGTIEWYEMEELRLHSSINGNNKAVLSITCQERSRTSGLLVSFRVYGEDRSIETFFKKWDTQKAISCITALLVPELRVDVKQTFRDHEARKFADIVYTHLNKNGGDSDLPVWMVQAVLALEKVFNVYAGLDVQNSVAAVKKEFLLLRNHLSEDDILSMWRESIVQEVIGS